MNLDRKTYIGGSDVASILGVSPWKSEFQLYQEKIGEWEEEISHQKEKLFARGKRWEPVVIDMLIDELQSRGHSVQVLDRNQRYRDAEYDFIAAEIDLELLIDGEEVNGEMKTVHPFAAKDWGAENSEDFPIYYQAQVMHGLMVKPRKRAIVAALIGADDLRVHWLNRDEEIIAGIRAKEIEFWRRVQERDAPEAVTHDDVSWLYKIGGNSVADATDEVMELVSKLQGIAAGFKLLEHEKEQAQIQIKKYMADAATLLYDGKPVLTWKNNKDSVKTDWQAAYLHAKNWLRENGLIGYANELDYFLAENTITTPGPRVFRLK